MKFDRSLFVKTAETQVLEDGTLFVYVDEETLESTGRVLIKSKTSSGGALFYADGTPQQWISVSERLPKKGTKSILLYSNGKISGGGYLGKRTWDIDYADVDLNVSVIAWMPLPEPYKE